MKYKLVKKQPNKNINILLELNLKKLNKNKIIEVDIR